MNPDNNKLNDFESEDNQNQTPDNQSSDDNITNPEYRGNENISEAGSDSVPEEEEKTSQNEAPHKNITRSRTNRIFLGVCSGLADYFDTDPLFFRLAFIISVIFGFWGILFYLILGIIIPEEPKPSIHEADQKQLNNENYKILIGSSLILFGLFLIVKDTRLFHFFQVWSFLAKFLVPTVLIIAGLFLLFHRKNFDSIPDKKLYRSVKDKKIAGVCAGLGDYLNIDPTIIRILWLIFIVSSFGIGILIYLLFVIIVPEEQEITNEDPSVYK